MLDQQSSTSPGDNGTATIHTGVANISPLWTTAYTKVGLAVALGTAVDDETDRVHCSHQAKAVVANLSNSDKASLGTGKILLIARVT